ncbi:serine/threonine-protein kinase [Streptomyces sp. NPDC090085]|uniref:serine/threonine-protein kinase n=1 Tax=Streptomyces sp. NPDC090085 TaxID=3365943 RepID=UPI0037F2A736
MVTEGENARLIAGRYRLDARLGRGGMGVVWRATDLLLGRNVAVKEVAADPALSEEEARRRRERTLREARAAAQLGHPHIIVVHDVVEDGEHPYIVMELVEGGSLADRLAAAGPVEPAEAARIGLALLGALRTAHAAGVLHRDIKPANVLLEEPGGRVEPESGGPLAVHQRAHARGATNNPGYRNASVAAATHNGRDAALWLFTWDGFSAAEGPRHTRDLCWEEDGRLYDVWVSAPVAQAEEARGYLDTALRTFVRTGG